MAESGCLRDANFQNVQGKKIAAKESFVINDRLMSFIENTSSIRIGNSTINPSNSLGEGLPEGHNISANQRKISNLDEPTESSDAATKGYVDAVAEGLHVLEACKVATTENINSLSGLSNIDDITISENDRILVKSQTSSSQNGIYLASSSSWTRSSDFNSVDLINPGDFVFVTGGTVNGGHGYVMVSNITTLGSDNIIWREFSGAENITDGDGLTKSGNIFSITTEGVTNDMLAGSIANDKLNTITTSDKVSGSAVQLANGSALANNTGLDVTVDNNSLENNSGTLRVKTTGVTNDMLAGSIADDKLNTITASDKVSGSAVQLASNPGLTNSSGLRILLKTSNPGLTTTDGLGVNVDDNTIGFNTNDENLEVKDSSISTAKLSNNAVTLGKLGRLDDQSLIIGRGSGTDLTTLSKGSNGQTLSVNSSGILAWTDQNSLITSLPNLTNVTIDGSDGLQLKNGTDSQGFIKFFEDGDNGTNFLTLKGAETLSDSSVTLTLPGTTGTLFSSGDTNMITADMLQTDSVTTVKITSGNVTNAKLEHDSLTIGSSEITLGTTQTAISGLTNVTIDGSDGLQLKNGNTSQGFIKFFEDGDNGTNFLTLKGSETLSDSSVTLTLSGNTGTLFSSGDTNMITEDMLQTDSVTTVKITNGNVTNAKLDHDSLTIGSSEITLGTTQTEIAGLTNVTIDGSGGLKLKNGNTSQGFIEFFEDGTNGTNFLTLKGAETLENDNIILTLSGNTGNIFSSGDTNMITEDMLQTDSVTTVKITDGNVTNAKLQNNSLSIVAGDGLSSTSESVSLGGSSTLSVRVDTSNGLEINNDLIRISDNGVTSSMLSGNISNDKLSTITTSNKVSGSAIQLASNSGLTDNSGLSILLKTSNPGLTTTGGLSVNIDDTTIGFNSGNLEVKDDSITLSKLQNITTGSLIIGGSGNNPELLSKGNNSTVLSISETGVVGWQALTNIEDILSSGSITATKLASDSVTTAKILNNSVINDKLSSNAVSTDKIVDNAVTLGKMAGISRGNLITGDTNGDPSYLTSGANGQILVATSDGDLSWTTLSGDATLDAGAITISNNAVTLGKLGRLDDQSLIIGRGNDTDLTTLSKGSNGQVLSVNSSGILAWANQNSLITGLTNLTNVTIDGSDGLQLKNGNTSQGFIKFFEDSDNGTNFLTLKGAETLSDSSVTLTLPGTTGTLFSSGDTNMITEDMLQTGSVTTVKITDGNVTNAKLEHNSLTIGSSEITLGTTQTEIAGLTNVTIDGSDGLQLKNGSTSSGFIKFFEDSDNGSNFLTLKGSETLENDNITLSLPVPSSNATLLDSINLDNQSVEYDSSSNLAVKVQTSATDEGGIEKTDDGLAVNLETNGDDTGGLEKTANGLAVKVPVTAKSGLIKTSDGISSISRSVVVELTWDGTSLWASSVTVDVPYLITKLTVILTGERSSGAYVYFRAGWSANNFDLLGNAGSNSGSQFTVLHSAFPSGVGTSTDESIFNAIRNDNSTPQQLRFRDADGGDPSSNNGSWIYQTASNKNTLHFTVSGSDNSITTIDPIVILEYIKI